MSCDVVNPEPTLTHKIDNRKDNQVSGDHFSRGTRLQIDIGSSFLYGEARLERLYSSGNPQAMSYALAGMRKLDRKRYAELIALARTSDATVLTMSGCIMTNEKLRKIVDELDSGKYDPWVR